MLHPANARFFGFVFLIIGLGLSACKTTRIDGGQPKKKSLKFLIGQLEKQQRSAEWFNGKAKLKFTEKGKTQSANAIIRMKKDSIIWVSISKVGYEAARMLITPDSVHLLIRPDKEYYPRSFDYFTREFNIDTDFKTLQNLILGNVPYLDRNKLKAKSNDQFHVLEGKDNGLYFEYYLEASQFLLTRILANDGKQGRNLQVDLSNYKAIKNFADFAHDLNLTFSLNGTQDVSVFLGFSKIEIDIPKKTPFSVSSRYKRM